MNENQKVWAQVYAIILSALQQSASRAPWEKLRERARIETDHALSIARSYND